MDKPRMAKKKKLKKKGFVINQFQKQKECFELQINYIMIVNKYVTT